MQNSKISIKFLALVIAIVIVVAFVVGIFACNSSRNVRVFVFTEGRGFYLFEIIDGHIFKFADVELDFNRVKELGVLDDFILKFPTVGEYAFWGATLRNEKEISFLEEERNEVLNLIDNVRKNRSDRAFEYLPLRGDAGTHDYVWAIIGGRTYWSSLHVYRENLRFFATSNAADYVNEDLIELVKALSDLADIDLGL